MAQKKDREVEKDCSASRFASTLRRLADAVEQGKRFTIQVGGERISVPANAKFSIEHEREGGEEELEFGVSWERK
ncbi:MAG TPA: amphi-Trp domain-containing protein [Deltaproteobacteria bacterium]|jgi:amphi-Trp domain-containing protein|nr:amphi-Trp domain-containing protein [Deltaproteobacteria bacterium]